MTRMRKFFSVVFVVLGVWVMALAMWLDDDMTTEILGRALAKAGFTITE